MIAIGRRVPRPWLVPSYLFDYGIVWLCLDEVHPDQNLFWRLRVP
jgi:hypothetical protein